MFFTLNEIVRWFGMTVFEMCLSLVAWFTFSVLAALKQENVLVTASWWTVFIPLFVCDGLNTYFCVIVFIRMYREAQYRVATFRFFSSIICLICMFVFKLLFCQKLNNKMGMSYSQMVSPLFIVLQIMMVKACQVY